MLPATEPLLSLCHCCGTVLLGVFLLLGLAACPKKPKSCQQYSTTAVVEAQRGSEVTKSVLSAGRGGCRPEPSTVAAG